MLTRRQILLGGLATAGASGGILTATGASVAQAYKDGFAAAELRAQTRVAKQRSRFNGKHQAGIEQRAQAHANFIGLDLKPGITKDDMLRWMVLLTDDITRLCNGEPVLADPEPDVMIGAANLSVTVGFGPGLFKKLSLESEMPIGFAELPSFKIDQLRDEFTGGDVLIQVGADDLLILSHASRALIRDSETFGQVKWQQAGFTNAVGVSPEGKTQRNLMGQVDGTDNPEFGTSDFARQVWINAGPAWAVGGTQLVLRRIQMNLNTWDVLGRTDKEEVIGRHLDSGAPLGQMHERDPIDFNAKKENGLPVIPPFAHIRRASATGPQEQFFRRPFNYQVVGATAGSIDAGLLWTAYSADLSKQYLPVQQRLSDFDLLNKWTTPIGSAVFAIARGFEPGEILAEELFN